MRTKHSLEFSLSVVRYYLSGQGGYKKTGLAFGIHRGTVAEWVAAYQCHGMDGITWKNDTHTPEFRLNVVRIVPAERLSLREAAARFNLSGKSVVRRWVSVYKISGALRRKCPC